MATPHKELVNVVVGELCCEPVTVGTQQQRSMLREEEVPSNPYRV